MKTIVIDGRFAHLRTGIGRYTREITEHLLRRSDPLRYVLVIDPAAATWASALTPQPQTEVVSVPHYSVREQWLLPRTLKHIGADLLFAPHFNVPLLCPIPFVVTVHDLILHRYPNTASRMKRIFYRLVMRHAVRSAEAVITVSNFVASELQTTYGQNAARKITVIPQGVSPLFRPASNDEQERVRTAFDLRSPYFLYVGNAKQHKNVQLLIDAFAAASVDADLLLVTSGQEVSSLRLAPRVRVLPDVDEPDLRALYTAARAFVTASLYEGFGLPIVEATACGCPILASRTSAIPEVAPKGSVLIEPSLASFAEAFSLSFSTQPVPHVRHWDEAAAETASVLLRAIH